MSDNRSIDKWPVATPPAEADVQALRAKLGAFNVNRAAIDKGQQIGIFRRDEAGDIIAGIYGWLWGECLEIVLLWIDEPLRGQGLGQQLLANMEEAGRERGARLAMLETFSFQAPDFYEQHGYETFGLIEGYGGRHAKHFMHKDLD